jgi:hypothetical protein
MKKTFSFFGIHHSYKQLPSQRDHLSQGWKRKERVEVVELRDEYSYMQMQG